MGVEDTETQSPSDDRRNMLYEPIEPSIGVGADIARQAITYDVEDTLRDAGDVRAVGYKPTRRIKMLALSYPERGRLAQSLATDGERLLERYRYHLLDQVLPEVVEGYLAVPWDELREMFESWDLYRRRDVNCIINPDVIARINQAKDRFLNPPNDCELLVNSDWEKARLIRLLLAVNYDVSLNSFHEPEIQIRKWEQRLARAANNGSNGDAFLDLEAKTLDLYSAEARKFWFRHDVLLRGYIGDWETSITYIRNIFDFVLESVYGNSLRRSMKSHLDQDQAVLLEHAVVKAICSASGGSST